MNNNQFRKLVLDNPARQASASSVVDGRSNAPAHNGAKSAANLGSRMRSSIPMTPRTIPGYCNSKDFARQLAERNELQQPIKKFKSSAAPRGAKLPEGYVDRAKARSAGDEDDKTKRVKALEEMMMLQQIDEPTFIQLREEILGSEVGLQRAGLVKGLDWTLLEKARKGEVEALDVLEEKSRIQPAGKSTDEVDVDDEFDKLEEREVEAIVTERIAKKGEMASSSLTGKKRNRNQILAELRASRQAAKEAVQPSLGSRFKKFGANNQEPRLEVDKKGREVLITVDEEGNEKRKVRKIQNVQEPRAKEIRGLLMPNKDSTPMGMEVPEMPKLVQEEELQDIDIFDDAGDDYDPLDGLDEPDSDDEIEIPQSTVQRPANADTNPAGSSMASPPGPTQSRNYFGTSEHSKTKEDSSKPKGFSNPMLLAALKKASSLNPVIQEADDTEEVAKEARRKRMLQADDRDAQDVDMGFGSSRFGDEEDFEENRVKLSEWGGKGDDNTEGARGEAKGKRKRGPKKKKDDKNNANDVMKFLELRKDKS